MIFYSAFFQPIAPDVSFPPTAFNLTLNGVSYCLPVPIDVADFLTVAVEQCDVFSRLDHYCNTLGIQELRDLPEAFESTFCRLTYAKAVLCTRTQRGAQSLTEMASCWRSG